MNLRWLIWDYVDPSVEIDRKTRRQVRAQAWRDMRASKVPVDPERRRRFKMLQLLQALIPGIVSFGVFSVTTMLSGPWWRIGLIVVVQLAVSLALMGLVVGFMVRPHVYELLRKRGYDVCLVCGYRLDGRTPEAARCPECGVDPETSSS